MADVLTTARNLVGVAALLPTSVAGLVVGGVKRDRRAGVDFAIEHWVDALLASAGVRVRVQGEEHLTADRPAVFIFNHRNNFDAFVAAKLIRTGFTSIGKKELADNPLSKFVGGLIDAVFIDRADSAGAIAAMQPIQEAVNKGLSLLVSPEGTRVETGAVGDFKKGPFRIAMAAGVPIVPIVIRNAEAIGARDATFMRPGVVDALVLAPIDTTDWSVAGLTDRIAEVRQQYVEALADWPA